MNNFLFIFIVCIVLLALLTLLISAALNKNIDQDFRDSKGNHSYYDRSLIEKEEFRKHNPDVYDKEIRSIRRLLRNLKNIRNLN